MTAFVIWESRLLCNNKTEVDEKRKTKCKTKVARVFPSGSALKVLTFLLIPN